MSQSLFPALRAALACGLMLLPTAAGAAAVDADADAGIETVTVVGSLIAGAAEDAAVPTTSIDAGDLRAQGAPNLLEVILDLPFSQGADGEADRFQGGGGTGVGADRATINLRGFGPSRTLVLINSRRLAWSPMAVGQDTQLLVDVNSLPAIALERLDFLRDGGAATYGSDAIAGVMNFITRSGFEGFEARIGRKAVRGSSGDTEIGLIGGFEFGGGRGRLVTSLGGIERSELELHKRDWALLSFADNPRGGWSSTGRPATFVPGDSRDADSLGIMDPNCAALGGAPTPANRRCRFQYTPFDNVVEQARRWQWFTEASWDLGAALAAFDAATVGFEYLRSDSRVPDWNTSPSYPPNRVIDPDRALRANNPALVDMARKHPQIYGDYALCDDAAACRWQGDGWDRVGWVLGRSYGQDGPLRAEPVQSSMRRAALTLDADAGALRLRASAVYSDAERALTQGDTMVYRDRRAVQGLGGAECERLVPNEYDAAGRLSFSRATLEAHAGSGPCLYWSPFSNGMHGAHPQVPDAAFRDNPDFNPALDNRRLFDYLLTERILRGDTSLLAIEGILSGPAPFGWDGVDFALGAQWRRETYRSGPPPGAWNDGIAHPCSTGPGITQCAAELRTGLFGFLPPHFAIDEERDIGSLFGELQFPLGAQAQGQFSLRYENYGGGVGASLDPKLALRWHLPRGFGLRASAGTTFRGPTLNQTVDGLSTNSLQYVAATGAFKSVATRGDPNLGPESATTANVGLLWDGDALLADADSASLAIDYWSYRFADPLVVEPFGRVIALACPGGACDPANPYYERIVFGGDASLANFQSVDVRIVNGPDISTDGIDFHVDYDFPAGAGRLRLSIDGTRILSYRIAAWALDDAYDALGRLNYRTSLARTLAEWKMRLQANYRRDAWNLRYAARYVSSYRNVPDGIGVAADLTHDAHLRWTPRGAAFSLTLSGLNLADSPPPYAGEELNYDAFTHKPLGRVFKLGVTYGRSE